MRCLSRLLKKVKEKLCAFFRKGILGRRNKVAKAQLGRCLFRSNKEVILFREELSRRRVAGEGWLREREGEEGSSHQIPLSCIAWGSHCLIAGDVGQVA